MKITQVICNDKVLQVGEIIVVEYKEILDDGEEGATITKEITIHGFTPLDDASGDIWIVDKDGNVFSDENFKSKCTEDFTNIK